MKRLATTALLAAVTAGVVAGGTMISYASWIAPPSTAKGKVRASSMPDGVTPGATIQSGQAVVSWSAQEIVSGVPMTAYVVTAHDTDATALPDVAHTVTASGAATESATFTARELAGGKWGWAIVPKFHAWAGAEGKLSTPKLVFPATAPLTVLAAAANGTTPVKPTPGNTPAAPEVDPSTSAPDKPAEPAKTETPTPSDSPREPTAPPSPSTSG